MHAPTDYIYLATPYSKYPSGHEAAFRDACRAAACLMRAGYRVFSPIAHSHPIASIGGLPLTDHDLWKAQDAPTLHRASAMIVVKMPTWDQSRGIAHEIEAFSAAGKPIFGMDWPVDLAKAPDLHPWNMPHLGK